MKKIFLYLAFGLLISACGSKSAPSDAGNGNAPQASDPSSVKPTPEPHYTTVPATGAFAGILPKGFEIVKSDSGEVITMGDLNADGKTDAAILIQNMDQEEGQAAILLALAQADGRFKMGEMSGNLGPEPLMYTDPGQIKIENGVLIFHYQSMRWSIDLKFRMEKKYGDLRLIGSESESYGNAMHDGAGSCSTNYLTGVRISNYMHYDETKDDVFPDPEKREKVSTELKAFNKFNEDQLFEL